MTLLEPWFRSRSRSITKSPKLYFNDTGVLLFLLAIHETPHLLASPLRGQIWETFAFAELRKQQLNRQGFWRLFFFRDRTLEVDFLLEQGNSFALFEAKWTEHPDLRDTANLQAVAKVIGKQHVKEKAILCPTPVSFPLTSDVTALALKDVADRVQ